MRHCFCGFEGEEEDILAAGSDEQFAWVGRAVRFGSIAKLQMREETMPTGSEKE
jgi:hypothetical protein